VEDYTKRTILNTLDRARNLANWAVERLEAGDFDQAWDWANDAEAAARSAKQMIREAQAQEVKQL
jgi:hypothetical protein